MPSSRAQGIAMLDVRPYAQAVQQAVVSGDLQHMKSTLAAAEKYLSEHGNVSAALEALKLEIRKLERTSQ
jgi:hypothetical protein